jgi:hypothetical protein
MLEKLSNRALGGRSVTPFGFALRKNSDSRAAICGDE